MMLNRKLTGGLAWGGLVLVLAVPSADIISAKMAGPGTATDPVTTASIDTPNVTIAPVTPVPLKGKPMPSYISDPDAPVTGVTAPVVPKPAPVKPVVRAVETATVQPDPVAPIPMPAHMRPLLPAQQPQIQQQPQVAVVNPPVQPQPLILDDAAVIQNEASVDPEPNVPRPPALVTEEDLQDWDSGSLADYLERRGLLSDASYSSQNVDQDPEYDPDGFYLSEGPNQQQPRRRRNDGGDSFVVFPSNN